MTRFHQSPARAITIACVLLFGAGAAVSGQPRLLAPASNVSFTISVRQGDMALADEVLVTYDIVNVGKSPLYVPRGWEATACLNIGPPRLSAHFEGRMGPGYGGSCSSTTGAPVPSLRDRMSKGTVWLLPGEHYGGVLQLLTAEVVPGPNTIVAVLQGWRQEDFTADEWTDLALMGSPFLAGEIQASTSITLTP